MKRSQYSIALLLTAAFLAGNAQAGTVIQQAEFEPSKPQSRQTVTVYLDAGKMRVEGDNPSSGKYLILFDEGRQTAWMADLAKGTYMEFTAAQVQQLAGQMQGMASQMQEAMKQMEAQMANMPPEQRAMMEQMMKGRMGGMAAAAPAAKTVRETARGQKVGAFTCTRYEVMTGGQRTQEVCAAPAGALQLDDSAMDTFKALAEFYEPLTRAASSFAGNWTVPSGMDEIDGFPVQTVTFSGQRATSEWRVEKVENRSIEASMFELPAGLKKSEMPQMPSR